MARIVGVDLPKNKRIIIALTYIFGIGPTTADLILSKLGIDFSTRVKDLSESEIVSIRDEVREQVTEGDLRRRVGQDVKRLMDIGSYRGNRHKRKLPVRGQRTHTNARTKKGKRLAIAGKKKVTK
ncbi:MAG: 30S ribosomal protein S13 [bacterium]|nr:30S ribosomal protein S13 [bacterium]